MDIAILSAVIFVLVYFTLDYLSNRYLGNDYFVNFMLLVFFAFSYANIDPEVAPYYFMMSIVVLMYTLIGFMLRRFRDDNSTSLELQGFGGSITVRGPMYYLLNIALGIGTVIFMRLLLSTQPDDKLQAFMGVPVLSLAALQTNLSYVTTMALANIENKFIIVVLKFFELLKEAIGKALISMMIVLLGWIPFINVFIFPVLMSFGAFFGLLGPLIMAAGIFGIFHLAAYNLVFGALFFAFAIMFIWLVLYKITGNDIVMNTGHMGWNFLITLIRRTGGGLV